MEELRNSTQLSEFIRKEGESLFPEFIGLEKFEEKEQVAIENNNKPDFLSLIFTPGKISFGIAAAVLLLFVYTFYYSGDDLVTDELITQSGNEDINIADSVSDNILLTDTISEYASHEIYAANFEESENLEFLMGQNYRSGDDLIIISPSDDEKIIEEVSFHWNYNSEVQLILLILDNNENVLFTFKVKADKLLFNVVDNGLDPGLYYWKLESEEDLFHIGKFIYEGK